MSDAAFAINVLGIFLFAMSGAGSARIAGLDLFGAAVVALVTATGGGFLRDLALGQTPRVFVDDWVASIALAAFVCFALIRGAEKAVQTKLFELGDTLGVVAFSIVGAQAALAAELAATGVLGLAFINANVGGVIRDLLCGRKPLVLTRKWNGSIAVLIGGAVLLCAEIGLTGEPVIIAIFCAALALGAALNLSGVEMRRM